MAVQGVQIVSIERLDDSTVHRGDWVVVKAVVENTTGSDTGSFNVDLFKNASGPSDYTGHPGDLSYTVRSLPGGKKLSIDFVFRALADLNCVVVIEPQKSDPSNLVASSQLGIPVSQEELLEDSYEENDTFETAKLITFPANNAGINLVSKDDDYYIVEGKPGDSIAVDLYDYAPEVSNLDLYLYDSSRNLVASSEGVRERERVTYRIPGTGNATVSYYLYVKSGLNPETYLLRGKVGPLPEISVTISVAKSLLYIDNVSAKTDTVVVNATDPDTDRDTYARTDTSTIDQAGGHKLLDYHFNNKVSVTISNSGAPLGAEDYFYLDLFRNKPVIPVAGDFGNAYVRRINASDLNSSGTVSVSWFDTYLIPAQYTYYAMVDSDNLVVETAEDNNLSGPVQVRTDFSAEPYGSNDISYTYQNTCVNNGLSRWDYLCTHARRDGEATDVVVHWSDLFVSLQDKIKDVVRGISVIPDDENENYASWGGNDVHPVDASNNSAYISFITKSAGKYPGLVSLDDDYYVVGVGSKQYFEVRLDANANYGNLGISLSRVDNKTVIVSDNHFSARKTLSYYNGSDTALSLVVHVTPLEGTNASYSLEFVKKNIVPQYDLMVDSVTITPIRPPDGGASTSNNINIQVKNSGNDKISSASLLFLSSVSSGPVDWSASEVLSYSVVDLAPGKMAGFDIEVPVNPDPLYYHITLDPDNLLPEANENNNYGYYLADAASFSDDYMETVGSSQNDSFLNASVVGLKSYQNLKGLDSDYYYYDIPSGQKISVSVLFEHRYGDIDFDISTSPDSQQLVLLDVSETTDDNEYLEYENTTGSTQRLYLHVNPLGSGNGYSLVLKELVPSQKSDLAISALVTSPPQLSEGQIFRSTVSVVNNGPVGVAANQKVMLDFYIERLNSSAPSQLYGRYFTVLPKDLASGETFYYTFEYQLSAGDYQVYAVVDIQDSVDELDETNNSYQPQPLKVYHASIPDLAGSVVSFIEGNKSGSWEGVVRVDNLGLGQVASFEYLCRLVDLEGRELYRWPVAVDQTVLNGGDFVELQLELVLPQDLVSDEYMLSVELDPSQQIIELTEENNIAVSSSTLSYTSPLITLVVETLRTLDSVDGSDTVIELYMEVNNQLVFLRRSDDANGIYSFIKAAVFPGVYYVKVYSYGSQTGSYSFYSGLRPRSGVEERNLKVPASYEKNNSVNSATTVILEEIQNQSIDSSNDVDWYRIEVQ